MKPDPKTKNEPGSETDQEPVSKRENEPDSEAENETDSDTENKLDFKSNTMSLKYFLCFSCIFMYSNATLDISQIENKYKAITVLKTYPSNAVENCFMYVSKVYIMYVLHCSA